MNIFKKSKNIKPMLVDDDEWMKDSMHIFFENEGCEIIVTRSTKTIVWNKL